MIENTKKNSRCYTTVSTAHLTKTEWLELRKTALTGTDAPKLMGVSKYGSPLSVYHEKTMEGVIEFENERLTQGADLEEYCAERFMRATGKKLIRSRRFYRNKQYPFLGADIDRLVVGEEAGFEAKTMLQTSYKPEEWADGAPPYYLYQVYHYMHCLGFKKWYLGLLVLGSDFIIREINWDENKIVDMVRTEVAFWNEHIVPRVLPDPIGSKYCDEALGEIFCAPKKETVHLLGMDESLRRRLEIDQMIEALDTERRNIDQSIKFQMGENEIAYIGQNRISWSSVTSSRLNTAKLKEEHPEVYDQYLVKTNTRRFQIKAA